MVNCDFCGKEIKGEAKRKKEAMLNDGNYCEECKDKGINELFEEILEDDESEEGDPDNKEDRENEEEDI